VWRRWRLAAALVLVVPLKLVLERVAKQLVQRQRPGTTVPDAILRGVPHHGLSFTSGHAIITFAIAGLLVLVLPRRWGVVAFVLATCNGLARVFLGAHNPLDVVGGAAIGLAIAAVLDIVLDVARDRGRRPGRTPARGKTGPPEEPVTRATAQLLDHSPAAHVRRPRVEGHCRIAGGAQECYRWYCIRGCPLARGP
jgi:undecaprenyl-diphosphatase